MAENKKIKILEDDALKEVSGGQTIGEWQAQHRIQPRTVGNQSLVKQGQSGTKNPLEFWEDVWCPLCKAPFRANIMLDEVHCPDPSHPAITIRG